MSNLIFSANIVFPLFVIILAGFLFRKTGFVDERFLHTADRLTFLFLLPIVLFVNVYQADLKSVLNGRLILFVFCGIVAVNLMAFLLVPLFVKDNGRRGTMIQAVTRSNYILIGIPICQLIYGIQGAVEVSVVAAVYVPTVNFFAVLALSTFNRGEKKGWKGLARNLISNPFIVSIFLALALNLSGIGFPEFLDRALSQIAAMATPFALLLLGAEFDMSSIRGNAKAIVLGTLSKLLLMPACVLAVAYLMGFRGLDYVIIMTAFASPVAVSSSIMAKNMACDDRLASHLVVSTTLFSAVSLFLLLFVSKSLGIM
ncbi:MAG: AEC family transporter [Anaerofustis sp.]